MSSIKVSGIFANNTTYVYIAEEDSFMLWMVYDDSEASLHSYVVYMKEWSVRELPVERDWIVVDLKMPSYIVCINRVTTCPSLAEYDGCQSRKSGSDDSMPWRSIPIPLTHRNHSSQHF